MSNERGMDIDEYSARSNEIGMGIDTLCGDLYAAIDDEISLAEVKDLLKLGEKKVELYKKLLSETTKSLHEEVIKSYGEYIDDIRKFSEQLKEIYHD